MLIYPLRKGVFKMAKRVVIDTDECVGCESCVELCSEVFAFNEDEEKANGHARGRP